MRWGGPWRAARWALAALVLLQGCGSGVSYRYYNLRVDAPPAASAPVGAVVQVALPEVAAVYHDTRLVVRQGAYQISYDRQHQWAAKPSLVFQDALYGYLSQSGAWGAVVLASSPSPPTLRLEAFIEVVEEDVSTSPPTARLAMELRLRGVRDGVVRWRGRVEGSRVLSQGGPTESLAAWSAVLSAGLKEALPGLIAASAED